MRDHAEDDRRLEAIGSAARSTVGREGSIEDLGVGTDGDRVNRCTRGRRVSETILYTADPKIHSAASRVLLKTPLHFSAPPFKGFDTPSESYQRTSVPLNRAERRGLVRVIVGFTLKRVIGH